MHPLRGRKPFTRLAASLWQSCTAWWRAGRPIATRLLYLRRRAICARCPHWLGRKFGSGKCDICGCATAIKLRMGSERCPDHPPRWDRVDKPGPLPGLD